MALIWHKSTHNCNTDGSHSLADTMSWDICPPSLPWSNVDKQYLIKIHHFNNIKYQKPPADTKNESDSDTDPQMPGLVPCSYCGSDSECETYVNDRNTINEVTDNEVNENQNMNIWTILGETKKYEGWRIWIP